MFGSDALLDSAGSGNEVDCFQGVLQRISNPRGSARTNANRNADIETHRLQLIPLAETLSRPVSDTNGSMSTNSPGTRGDNRRDHSTRRNTTVQWDHPGNCEC